MSEKIKLKKQNVTVKRIAELAVIHNGIDYKHNPKGEEIPIYGTGGIMGFTSVALNEGPAVLTGRKGTINRPFYVEGKFWNVDTIFCLKPLENVNAKWLYYSILNSDMNKLNEATGVPSVTSKSLYNLRINYEKFSKQCYIAKILTTCDKVIEQTEAAIAKYKSIKQGMLHDLFTRGLDENGKLRPAPSEAPNLYKESELGLIPKDWEPKLLENITTKIGDGIHTTPIYKESTDYYFINGNNLCDGNIIFDNKTNTVSKEEYEKHKIELNSSTILISINGTIGNLAFYNEELIILGKSACYICCESFIKKDFLYYLFETSYTEQYFINELTGSTIKNLSLNSIRNMPINLPSIKEQQAINERLNSIDKKIKAEIIIGNKYKVIKKGLMTKLLRGE